MAAATSSKTVVKNGTGKSVYAKRDAVMTLAAKIREARDAAARPA